ncbi:MAG: DNA alkylation repair protein [Thermoplasmata archaeon]|nr:DNA alkylation repair protein [Thermoplasmata archaeon]
MQRYMRSTMPYHGVSSARLREVARRRFGGLSFRTALDWSRTTRYLWRHAKCREERYAAIALAGSRPARAFQTPAALPVYEEMIRTGAWWDFVDEVAVHRLGPILRQFPGPMSAEMRSWADGDDLWKRRSSIICQVGSRTATDRVLLFDCLRPSLERREFFLRKAIGWALRQYARVEPSVVADYVSRNERRLSPLSRKEALRRIRL